MSEKRDIESKAKVLIDSSPDEAVILYKKLWDEYTQDFNAWDAFFSLKAIRKCTAFDLEFVDNIVNRFSEDEKVKGLYGWFVFDNYVKGKSKPQLLEGEGRITHMCELVTQKDSNADDTYPCPVSIAVFKMTDAYSENLFNERKINEWLKRINPELLSSKPGKKNTEQRGEIEIASDFEKYYALKTKALLKLCEFETCKNLCETILSRIDNFHYNNDLWFKMRIAICEEKLGNLASSEHLFQELLHTKAGSDKWFLYRDIAELYYDQGNYHKAWKYAVDAALYGNEPHFLIKLYLLQARILFKLNRSDEGKILASLIAAILNEQEWNNKEVYDKLFKHYGLELSHVENVRVVFRKTKEFWIQERYKGLDSQKGRIIFIHRNNKFGKIKTDKGAVYDFHRRDLIQKERNLQSLKDLDAEFIAMPSYDGKLIAERIKVNKTIKKNNSEIVGQVLEGTVRRIVEFGMFIGFENYRDGLLHRNSLPYELKDTFSSKYKRGDKIKVKIMAENQKGLELRFIK